MDSTSVVLMDHAIRRNPSYYNHDNFLLPKSSSLTLDQQQKLLFLLNNHARVGSGRGGGAVGFLQPSPPSSYGSQNRPPIHASLPYGQLNKSNPPILPLPFSRSSSLPSPVGGNQRMPRVVRRKKPTLVVTKKKKETPPPPPPTPTTTSDVISIKNSSTKEEEEVDYYSLSPPPSSLPLPKFSLKPKVK